MPHGVNVALLHQLVYQHSTLFLSQHDPHGQWPSDGSVMRA